MGRAGETHPLRSLIVLCYATLSYGLAQTMIVPALPRLIPGLHTNANDVAWTLTGYFLSAAVCTPIAGRLGDMFGKRQMSVIAMAGFGGGALIAAASSSLVVVVVGRVVQGVGGAIFALAFGLARDLFPRRLLARNVGFLAATGGIGAALGLIAGGLIADHVSYHWIFWLSGFMGISAASAIHLLLTESPERSGGRVDMRGAAVLAVGLAVPLFAVSKAAAWGWADLRTVGLIAAGLAVLAAWTRLELRTKEPLADIRLLRSPAIAATNVSTVLASFGVFASFVLIPQLAQAPTATGYGLGLDATGAGLLMLPGSCVMILCGPASGALGSRVGNKIPLVLGSTVATVALILLGLAHGSMGELLPLSALMFGGIGLTFAATANLIIDCVEPARTSEATGFNSVVRLVGMSIGAQVTASVLAGSIGPGSALPADRGYTTAFLVAAALALVATVASLLIPPPRRHGHLPALHELGVASPVAEPTYSAEP